MQTHTIALVPSGRDLWRLRQEKTAVAPKETGPQVVLVGNPAFDGTPERVADLANSHKGALRAGCGLEITTHFTPLSGQELDAIRTVALRSFAPTTLLTQQGPGATEAWVRQYLPGARYAHLDTHGFFAGEACAPPAGSPARAQDSFPTEARGYVGTNPLLHAGIALTGANHRTTASIGADDGILTALEVTGLNLQGTELVVLSACETGIGTVQAGQELQGLRWAFSMAGAKSLLTSLWKVPAVTTREVMRHFYTNLWRTPEVNDPMGKAEALRLAQLALMQANSQQHNGDSRPADWAGWVLSGDWE